MKVLLVQRRHDHGRLRQSLQRESIREFQWRRVLTEHELRIAAAEYQPTVVLCADDMLASSPQTTLDLLGVLGKEPPQLMICEVADDNAPWASAAAEASGPWLRPSFGEFPAEARSVVTELNPRESCGMPAGRPRLPTTLKSNVEAVLLLDDNGWITDLNPHAQQVLGIAPHRPKAQAHVQDLIEALHAAGEGRCTTLPLVALNLDGLLLLNALPEGRYGDAALDLIASVVQPQFARCGLLARVGVNQYLAVLPHLSPAADAAVSAGANRRAESEGDLATVFGIASSNDADIMRAPRESSIAAAAQWPTRIATPQVEAAPDDLDSTLAWHALSVHFQPQYELAGGRGCGAEALARWTLSSGKSLSPAQFIPIAERNGTLGALDAFVLKSACATALKWRGAAADRLTLSVNVPDREIAPEYVRLLAETLFTSHFPAQRLELEIGEAPVTSNSPAVKEWLSECKKLGVRIAVTHRTANYSTLDYLVRTSVDRLKLDRSLIHRMTQDKGTAAAVAAIIALCAELQVDVMAEGVETQAQLAMLRDFNCPKIQGFLLARPMPAVQAQVVLGKTWGNFKPSAAPSLAVAH